MHSVQALQTSNTEGLLKEILIAKNDQFHAWIVNVVVLVKMIVIVIMWGRFVRTVHPFADEVKRDKPPTTAPCNLWGTKVSVIYLLI